MESHNIAEENLSNISRGFRKFVIEQGKILRDLESVCNFVGVDYLDA